VKLISSGKILENNKTVGQCKTPFGDIAGGVIVMHVVVQPSLAKSKTGSCLSMCNVLHVFYIREFPFHGDICVLRGSSIFH